MRKMLVIAVALTAVLGLVGGATAGASAPAKKPPVKLSGKVTNKGTKSVKGGKIKLEADDFYFKPSFIKGTAGSTVKVTIENEGSATHTFTADDNSFDKNLSPGDKATVTVTIPADGSPLAFHCNFHGDQGMKGAFFSKANATATSKDSGATATTKPASSGYGY
jgi:plastocyanin